MNILARWLPASLLLLAAAGDSPALTPVRDVAVTYRVVKAVAPGGPAKLVIQQTAGAMKMRIDSYIFPDARTPYEGVMVDRTSGEVSVLVYGRQIVVGTHPPRFTMPGITMTPDMRFQRRDERTIAGLQCTDWAVAPATGEPWTACITGDGVVLRTASANREMEATSVTFEPLPASTFVPDRDLRHMVTVPAKP